MLLITTDVNKENEYTNLVCSIEHHIKNNFFFQTTKKVRASKDESRRPAATSWPNVFASIRVLLDSPTSLIIVLAAILATTT
jgi:hypothetical protein